MSDCDEWEGWKDQHGYGRLHIAYVDGKRVAMYTHRLVWMQTNGHTDLFICHHCDNPSCMNPEHLYAGTQADNMADMVKRGRAKNAEMGKTHCKRGHEFTPENIYIGTSGSRQCRECRKARQIKYLQLTSLRGA